jgi:hypothetical protein
VPCCIATAALVIADATSTGGLVALAVKRRTSMAARSAALAQAFEAKVQD